MRKGNGNFIESDDIRLLQWLSLFIEDYSAGGSISKEIKITNGKTILIKIIVEVVDEAKL